MDKRGGGYQAVLAHTSMMNQASLVQPQRTVLEDNSQHPSVYISPGILSHLQVQGNDSDLMESLPPSSPCLGSPVVIASALGFESSDWRIGAQSPVPDSERLSPIIVQQEKSTPPISSDGITSKDYELAKTAEALAAKRRELQAFTEQSRCKLRKLTMDVQSLEETFYANILEELADKQKQLTKGGYGQYDDPHGIVLKTIDELREMAKHKAIGLIWE
ncbi:hypothetical protein M422DRAFT_241956 [Sphaerobolus stellatus SS14]|nr:hypothetical protein M422DRAFT_241956 [Sphaerobolus stellatus SS14]